MSFVVPGGYYTRILSHSPKIRAVVLNTNLYLVANTATEGESDPGGQLAWLENVMNSARSNGEKVGEIMLLLLHRLCFN